MCCLRFLWCWKLRAGWLQLMLHGLQALSWLLDILSEGILGVSLVFTQCSPASPPVQQTQLPQRVVSPIICVKFLQEEFLPHAGEDDSHPVLAGLPLKQLPAAERPPLREECELADVQVLPNPS